jgi:hypothetical protein
MEELEADDHLEAMVQAPPDNVPALCDGRMHPRVFRTEHLYKKIKTK